MISPNKNEIKKVIEYKFNDNGNKVKITITTPTRKLANARLSKRTIECQSWPQFGNVVHEDIRARLTMELFGCGFAETSKLSVLALCFFSLI
nr:hypothetical protein CFP56_53435 [Quercus suber]